MARAITPETSSEPTGETEVLVDAAAPVEAETLENETLVYEAAPFERGDAAERVDAETVDLGTERLTAEPPLTAPVPPVAQASGRSPMRGTAIAWGIILLVIAAIAWMASTVDLWTVSTQGIVTAVVLLGAVLVGVGILGAVVRAVSKRN